jgi:hypothetical protein
MAWASTALAALQGPGVKQQKVKTECASNKIGKYFLRFDKTQDVCLLHWDKM